MPRGRTPKPAELVKLENRRGTIAHRQKTDATLPVEVLPQLDVDVPDDRIYKHITASDFYKKISEVLHGAGVLRQTDETFLVMLSEAAERVSYYTEKCKGIEVATIDGQIQFHPFYHLVTRERQFLFMGLRELGLTPASRARVMRDVAIGQAFAQQARRFEF